MTFCPYCNSEHFTKDYVEGQKGNGYNLCINCNRWSLFNAEKDIQESIEDPELWPQSQ